MTAFSFCVVTEQVSYYFFLQQSPFFWSAAALSVEQASALARQPQCFSLVHAHLSLQSQAFLATSLDCFLQHSPFFWSAAVLSVEQASAFARQPQCFSSLQTHLPLQSQVFLATSLASFLQHCLALVSFFAGVLSCACAEAVPIARRQARAKITFFILLY